MTESAPVYINCYCDSKESDTSFSVSHHDFCRIHKVGDTIRLTSRTSDVTFSLTDARRLALNILDLMDQPVIPEPRSDALRRVRKVGGSFEHTGMLVAEFKTLRGESRVVLEFDAPVQGMLHVYRPDQVEIIDTPPIPVNSGDKIVDAVRDRLLNRSLIGQQKYGEKMTREDLTLHDWVVHAQEEALDTAVYLERLGQDLERLADDGR